MKLSAISTALLSATGLFASDTILLHGHVYTGNDKMLWAQAVALTGTRIDAVGSDQEISTHRETTTHVIDLKGRTVIPGISDAHTHMWFGGLALRGFNFSTPELHLTADDPEPLIAGIKAYAAAHPKDKVLFGRAQFSIAPNSSAVHQLLDRAVPDLPVVIHNTSEHSLWVNAKARSRWPALAINLPPIHWKRNMSCAIRAAIPPAFSSNIDGPKLAQLILSHPESFQSQSFCYQSYPLIPDYLAQSAGGPEKASVDSLIPSASIGYSTTPFRPLLSRRSA